jgi:hypothetical protein
MKNSCFMMVNPDDRMKMLMSHRNILRLSPPRA